jgi:hypothetical protein
MINLSKIKQSNSLKFSRKLKSVKFTYIDALDFINTCTTAMPPGVNYSLIITLEYKDATIKLNNVEDFENFIDGNTDSYNPGNFTVFVYGTEFNHSDYSKTTAYCCSISVGEISIITVESSNPTWFYQTRKMLIDTFNKLPSGPYWKSNIILAVIPFIIGVIFGLFTLVGVDTLLLMGPALLASILAVAIYMHKFYKTNTIDFSDVKKY